MNNVYCSLTTEISLLKNEHADLLKKVNEKALLINNDIYFGPFDQYENMFESSIDYMVIKL
jgi:hypothetical protein